MNKSTSIAVWNSNEPISIPSSATPNEIANQAKQLSPRDVKAICLAMEAESYEMVSTFVWSRAATSLKKQIATLGMDFVGEMLGRADITESSDPATTIGDYEAISLAEDLGMVTTTEAMRLKHGLTMVTHFADPEIATHEQMYKEEAISLLRSCVSNVLGNETIAPPIQFADLRKSLESETLKEDGPQVQSIIASPYFFKRTTLSVLLSLIKTANGAQLEHSIGNSNVIIPSIWGELKQTEKWQIGQSYAEVTATGNRTAAVGLKKLLTNVHGFDFVPETLRSKTFTLAAHQVMTAHFGMNNFYNERKPIEQLASLGTTIPRPAFPVCLTAVLCVRLGNYYGHTFDAQPAATSILANLRREQWEYYFNECLESDKEILDKLSSDDKPIKNWLTLVKEYNLEELDIDNKDIRSLLTHQNSRTQQIKNIATKLRMRIH